LPAILVSASRAHLTRLRRGLRARRRRPFRGVQRPRDVGGEPAVSQLDIEARALAYRLDGSDRAAGLVAYEGETTLENPLIAERGEELCLAVEAAALLSHASGEGLLGPEGQFSDPHEAC
jgi:hypothetical protein